MGWDTKIKLSLLLILNRIFKTTELDFLNKDLKTKKKKKMDYISQVEKPSVPPLTVHLSSFFKQAAWTKVLSVTTFPNIIKFPNE